MPYARWTLLFLATVAFILISFALFGDQMEQWTRAFVDSNAGWWTTAAVLAGLLALDIFLPVPSSLVSTAAGALLGFWGGVVTSWTGMSAACALGYVVGTRVSSSGQLDQIRKARERFGDYILVLFRPVPVLAEASVLVAGYSRMPHRRFLWITSLSNLGISLAYSGVGAHSVTHKSFLLAFAGALLIPAVGLLATRQLRSPR
jgi:uncharacterized membrane protein YdjX (TVP38/TMEM64 family)